MHAAHISALLRRIFHRSPRKLDRDELGQAAERAIIVAIMDLHKAERALALWTSAYRKSIGRSQPGVGGRPNGAD